MPNHKIICAKSEIELTKLKENSIDSCVTDPPYGLEFMGKDWDKLWDKRGKNGSWMNRDEKEYRNYLNRGNRKKDGYASITKCPNYVAGKEAEKWHYQWAIELYRVMKPGAHILVFGGTRTYHRMACAIEDAGFEVRDMIEWFYGGGFPKSLDISKQIIKLQDEDGKFVLPNDFKEAGLTGTGLKPAHEPILLARKPISEHNIASNVLKWGVGGINVDACRIETNGRPLIESESSASLSCYGDGLSHSHGMGTTKQGRFPANLILDEEAGEMLDEQSGETESTDSIRHNNQVDITGKKGIYGKYNNKDTQGFSDRGGASRFFYQAKASQSERWFYCTFCKRSDQIKNRDKHIHNAPSETRYKHLEFHPTQKPIQLIQYLIRLITPTGKTIIDPFLGSGTALIAAEREQVNCIGIDSNQAYCNIANQRIKEELNQTNLFGEKSNITFI